MAQFTSIHGKRFGLGPSGNLVSVSSSDLSITAPCINAIITIGDEAANVRNITVQLKDANGADISYAEVVSLYVFSDATRQALATGGSTGIEAGTDGAILTTHSAKQIFEIVSEADGDIDLTWTDTGTESVVLGFRMPSGVWIMSDAFANA